MLSSSEGRNGRIAVTANMWCMRICTSLRALFRSPQTKQKHRGLTVVVVLVEVEECRSLCDAAVAAGASDAAAGEATRVGARPH